MKIALCLFFLLTCGLPTGLAQNAVPSKPEAGSVESKRPTTKTPKKARRAKAIDPALPMVLILGDSISLGYTGKVAEALKGKANVRHNPGNSQGTTHTLQHLDGWLATHAWDVIHFNLGLHDLKRVNVAGTSQNSNDPVDPRQADLETYTANLKQIVAKLKASGAQLVFATTTPFPAGVKPFRDPEDAVRYNQAARKIMAANKIPVNDLYGLMLPTLAEHQKPVNVHFHSAGSMRMAEQVARMIEARLPATPVP